jgi:NADH-quinone oxidoreductase subunit N
VAPKLTGLGVLLKFILTMNVVNQDNTDWQVILAVISLLTITIGNFSALKQTSFKRLMAYSSIAHSGFLMIGIVVFLPIGIQFMLFYASIYLLMNFLVFFYLDFFESKSIHSISDFKGLGKSYPIALVCLLVGLVSLTGLPPTSGFTAKLLIFSSLWQSYEISGKSILAVLLIFGLLNSVISIFYYLRIPYFAFLKSGETPERQNIHSSANLLGAFLVVLILIFFFFPSLLMGWINKINFVL